MLKKAVSILSIACWATGVAAQVPYPTPTSREKTIFVGDINYRNVDGRLASVISNIRITIIEEDTGNGPVKTHFVADYAIYNITWYKQGNWSIALDIRDGAGNVIAPRAISLPVDRNSCTYGGSRPEHQEGLITSAVFQNAQSGTLGGQTIIGRYDQPC